MEALAKDEEGARLIKKERERLNKRFAEAIERQEEAGRQGGAQRREPQLIGSLLPGLGPERGVREQGRSLDDVCHRQIQAHGWVRAFQSHD